jgi:helix-turn-helix protein
MSDKLRKAYRFATVPEHLIRDRALSDRAVRLWCLLDRYAGKDDCAFPSRETLSNDLSCSRASVDRAVAELVSAGWLSKIRRFQGGVNEYTLLIALVPAEDKKAQVRGGGVLTSADTPLSSPMTTPPLVTGEDTLSSPMQTPVITHDAQKEASGNEHQLTETSGASLRSAPGDDSSVTDGASSTRTIGDEPVSDDVERVCQHLADRIETNGSNRPTIGKKWHDAARLMMTPKPRGDGRTEDQVHKAIDWCQNDEFWRGVILSMPKLRAQYEALRLAAQRSPGGTPSNVHRLPVDHADHQKLVQTLGGRA